MTATAEDKIITDSELNEATDALLDAVSDEQTADTADQAAAPADEPAAALRIVKGNPSDAEIAALVSVLAAAAAGSGESEGDGKPPETWGNPTRMHRRWAPFSPYSYPNLG